MKAIVPTAGRGTRLFPHTHTKPKSMVRIAGKPILGHILSGFESTAVSEVVIVVGGPMSDQVVEYARDAYGDAFDLTFVEQADPEGLGHSVYQTRPVVADDPAIIVLGDMLFENGYDEFLAAHDGSSAGSVGVKPVDEPEHYGVVDTYEGAVVDLIEKPSEPPSDLAITGVYVIEDTATLFDELEYLIENDVRGAGDEYQLTDALQGMTDRGCTLTTFEVDDWYDCGRPETLLEANRVTLDETETNGGDRPTIVPPVDCGDDVTVEGSVVGPHVSLADGVTVENSVVRDSILGREATLTDCNVARSIVGDNATIVGESKELDVGDNSTVEL
ncbi:sugar phosphate nucleotidyltransferase [Halostella pelagica]|uniref:sugar phosphate nucleotidyltransferase n=1 Tax=Halostella pelagica TaxID=2583824 RepID=UPI001080FB06|nr:sugar phosphate nucleotidyltransferase [Halostella pelagica]